MSTIRRSFKALLPLVLLYVVLRPRQARAESPTTTECLAASEASLQFGAQHLLRTERNQLLMCSAASCPGDVRRECLRRVEEVNASIPTIIFEARDATGQDLGSVKVTLDGQLLVERLDGTALALDPGEHTFRFETAGQPAIEKRLVIREAQKDRHEAITFGGPPPAPGVVRAAPLADAPGAVAQAPAPAPAPTTPAPVPSEGVSTAPTTNPVRVVGYVVAGVGVVGLGLGALMHFEATSENERALDTCTGGPSGSQCASQEDFSNHTGHVNSAKSNRTVSYAALGVGAAALVTGAVLIAVGHSAEQPAAMAFAPVVGPHDLGFGVYGAF